MAARTTNTARVRIPFFWWQAEAAQPAPAGAQLTYLRTDTDYIPSSTSDLWRTTARRPAAA